MPNASKFDPAKNPLGTQNMEETYLAAADDFLLGQINANIILTQPNLDVSDLDPGLGTTIAAFQARMKRNAGYFLNKLMPGFITTIVDASNFSALVSAVASTTRADLLNAYTDPGTAKSVSNAADTLSDQAGTVFVDVNSLNASYLAGEKSVTSYSKSYDDSLTSAISLLSSSAKQVSSDIDALQKAIAQNIQDIVEGGKELGNAVTQLGTGILTMISGAAKDPDPTKEGDKGDGDKDKDKGDKTKPEKPATPNVDFAVQAIQAGISGETKASAAMQALDANNKKMAAAYQALASENALVAIAKVIQVQNKMFLDSFTQAGLDIHDLAVEWTAVESAFSDFSDQVANLPNQSVATNLAAELQGARTLWSALQGQIDYTKSILTGVL